MRRRTEPLLLKRYLLLFGLWLVLTGGSVKGILPGMAVAAAAALVSRALASPDRQGLSLPRLLMLAPGFLLRSLAGGIDVAWRAFHPRLPLKPGWIRCPSNLPPGAPRAILGGEISLLPGTLVAGEDGRGLLVHCLDRDQAVARQVRQEEERLTRAVGR